MNDAQTCEMPGTSSGVPLPTWRPYEPSESGEYLVVEMYSVSGWRALAYVLNGAKIRRSGSLSSGFTEILNEDEEILALFDSHKILSYSFVRISVINEAPADA